MKRFIFGLAFLATMFAGCQTEPMNKPSIVGSTAFEASAEVFVPQTKTSMTQDKQVVWSHNDRLAIFQGCTVADEFLVTDSSAGKTNGTFNIVSDNSEVNGSFSAGTEVPCNVAIYPYADGLLLSGASIDGGTSYEIEGVVLPAVQNYVAGSFGNGAFPMVAVTETMSDHTLRFKNVLGAMKLQLKGTQTVVSIKVEGKNSERLSGSAIVTAYANGLTPAITMTDTDDSAKSVILDCGDGVQLSESTATEFIVSLPPVLFIDGFIVTVTGSESQTYEIDSTSPNAVLRSSILVMPVVTLGEELEEEDDVTYVERVFLDKDALTMMPGTGYNLVADIDPLNVTYSNLSWTSSDNAIASVDQNGLVTAKGDGETTITVLAIGGASATCSVMVKTPKVFTIGEYKDYVDEFDVNYGKGVAVAGVIWAPVNCGYEPAVGYYRGYPYGKLYQWGRRYGHGYDYNDASYPSGENLILAQVVPSWGNSEEYKEVFFYGEANWCNQSLFDLWVDNEGMKTANDPCPEGWRLPTYNELSALASNYFYTSKDNQNGAYFVGEYTYLDCLPKVFLPAAGYRDYYNGEGKARNKGYYGYYWSSSPYGKGFYYDYCAGGMHFTPTRVEVGNEFRAYGCSVRCVQITD